MGELAPIARRGPGRSAGGRSPTARPSSGSAGWSRRRGATRASIDDPSLLAQRRGGRSILQPRERVSSGRLAARPIGHATMLLGAGRARVDSPIDPAVGVILHKKVGDPVEAGEPLCTLLVNDESRLQEAAIADPGCLHDRRRARRLRSR